MSDIKTPYLNGHMYEFDLCWLVEKILSFESQLNQAIDLKTIHYADPIQWDITTQYAPNTVVVDSKSGTAYMSKVPVPAGILLGNTDYWVVIFNYQEIYTKIMEGVAFYNGQTDFASKALLVNDLVWYGLDLYRVTRAIEEGGKLIPGTNLVKTSIESLLSNYYGRDRVTTLLNDTLNVSGDYTVNAGDVAETSTNHTTKITADHHIDIDGNDFIHVDGTSTIDIGGARTETYINDKKEKVTGDFTGDYGSANITVHSFSLPINFPDKTVDLHDINKNFFISPQDFGAKGDGTTDDTQAFKNALTYAKTNGAKITIPVGSYKLTEYIITDEKYIGENLGLYPNDKLIYSVNLKGSSFASDFYKAVPLEFIKNGMTTGGQQSAVYIPSRNVVIIGFSATESDDSLLVEMSADFTTVKQRVRAHLGHCNDLTYNPNTNKIYASIYDLGSGIIGVVNPVSLSVEETVNINGITTGITMVSYDSTNKVYYMLADALYITDSNFVIIKKIAIDISIGSLFYPNEYSAAQGSEIVNGMFTSLTWISNSQYCENARLLTVDYETAKVKNYYDYPVFQQFDEPESLVVMDDTLLVIGYEPNNLLIRKVNINETGSIVNPVGVNNFTSTEYTLYVDETKSVNGDGISKNTPINDLEYALKLAKFNHSVTIILLSNTIKTSTIYFSHYRGLLLIKGDKGTEELSRNIVFNDVNMIYLDNFVIKCLKPGNMIALMLSECYVYATVKFVGNGTSTGNIISVLCTALSRVHFENSVFNNCDVCVKVGNGGYAMMWNCSGSGNNILANNNGGLIMLTTLKPLSTTVSTKNEYGGLTVLNAQEIPTDYPQTPT